MSKLTLAVPNFPGKEKMIRVTSRLALKVSKHSPEICVGAGIVAGVGATVLACRATLHIEEVMADYRETMNNIDILKERAKNGEQFKDYSVEAAQRDKFVATVQMITKIGKLYTPAIIAGTVSIGFILGGHHILAKRNAALSIAYAGLQKAYDEYRSRVRDAVGEEKEMDIYRGVKEIITEETNEKGKITKKKANELGAPASIYSRIFDESSQWWRPNAEQNKFFLLTVQAHCNDILKIRGHLFLNEVFDMLDITRCPMGQDVGWIYGEGDSYVDFGIWDASNASKRAFINCDERNVWLDFNVDGFIKDKI